MNWMERARHEIQKSAPRRTANNAERNLTAVMAVPPPALRAKLEVSIGSNGSTAPSHSLEIELVSSKNAQRSWSLTVA
jgi:hypothetical protein